MVCGCGGRMHANSLVLYNIFENYWAFHSISPGAKRIPSRSTNLGVFADFENRQEGLLRNVYLANAFHSFLAFLLLFQQLTFAADVATVALGEHILADGTHGRARDDLRSDRRLDRHLEHLPWNQLAHLLHQRLPAVVCRVTVDNDRERIYRIPANKDIHLDHRRNPVPVHVVVERRVSARDGLQPVIEVEHDLVQRKLVRQHHAGLGYVLKVHLTTALLFHQFQNATNVLLVSQDLRQNDRLLNALDVRGIGPA